MMQVAGDPQKAIHSRLYGLQLLVQTGNAMVGDDIHTPKGQAELKDLIDLATLALCYNPCDYVTWDSIASNVSFCSRIYSAQSHRRAVNVSLAIPARLI